MSLSVFKFIKTTIFSFNLEDALFCAVFSFYELYTFSYERAELYDPTLNGE